jgi:uncharacterized alkaline shock family protein YloU
VTELTGLKVVEVNVYIQDIKIKSEVQPTEEEAPNVK